MANIETVKDCYGCKSCAYVCGVSAIKGIIDAEGFWYPHVDRDACIECGRCLLVCPRIYMKMSKGKLYVGAKHIHKGRRKAATSGGFFDVMAQWFIENGGIVFASKFDENLKVKYCCLDRVEDIADYYGSKYVSSKLSLADIAEIENTLRERNVLFIGTPCQCAGIRNLFPDDDRLYILDFYCHGVPGAAIWKKYIDRLMKRYDGKLTDYQFRNKNNGWHNSGVYYGTQWGGNQKRIGEDVFTRWYFVKGMFRGSCYHCQFRMIERVGDITMGDFWGIEKVDPGFDDDMGVSLLSVNTKKGMAIWDALHDQLDWKAYYADVVPAVNYEVRTMPFGVYIRRMIYRALPFYPIFLILSGVSKKSIVDRIITWSKRKQSK